jgi:two-component sensor histidine kinase
MKTAARIALIYLVVSILWITISDRVLAVLVSSPEMITQIQTYKGLAFISANTLLLFYLVRSHFQVIESKLGVEQKMNITQRLLLREVDHRVRNNLAELGSLLTIYRRSSVSIPDLTERLQRRIFGFKLAHELIATSGFEPVALDRILEKSLAGHGRAVLDIKTHPQEVFDIDPLQVSALVAALQEVAHHAGVCAHSPDAHVQLTADWSAGPVDGEQASFGLVKMANVILVVQGPSGEAHGRFFNSRDSGSGRSLVEGLVRFNLAGEVQISISGSDLICRIDVPSEGLKTMDHPVADVRGKK